MATICMHCAMKAFVAQDGKMAPGHVNFVQSHGVFDETPAEHAATHHPDPAADFAERPALEAKTRVIIARLMKEAGSV